MPFGFQEYFDPYSAEGSANRPESPQEAMARMKASAQPEQPGFGDMLQDVSGPPGMNQADQAYWKMYNNPSTEPHMIRKKQQAEQVLRSKYPQYFKGR